MLNKVLFAVIGVLGIATVASAETLSQRLSGRILLQVESHGESWYVQPSSGERFYMGRAEDAYDLMRRLGIGITNNDLNKIPVAEANFNGQDSDGDGLSDRIENSFGTNILSNDSDNDSYSDKIEILNGFNPLGLGRQNINLTFAGNHLGKIFLQVEAHGEAWYINPVNRKRYYLGVPTDAYALMRSLGLGITNYNLNLIPISRLSIPLPASPSMTTPVPLPVPIVVTPVPLPAPIVVTPEPLPAPIVVTPAPPVVVTPITPNVNNVKKRAVVIVYKNVYDALKLDIDNFQNDVFAGLGVKVDIIQLQDSLSYTPLHIRNLLINECQLDGINGCLNLEGAVLVGDIPYALYEQPFDNNHLAPFMYFYEDLDAGFKQNNLGHYYGYNSYGSHGGPEIYTGWIRSTFPSTDLNNHINQLRAYFQKHHNFFTKQSVPSQWAVSAIHVPYPDGNDHYLSIPNLGLTVYGTENSIDITPDIADVLAPFKPALLAELSKGPEVAYLHSHGGPTVVWGLTASDFSNLANLPLFMLTWGCSNGNFMENEKDSITLAFIHGKNLGLSFLSKLDSNDIDVYSGNCPNCGFFNNNQFNFFKYYNEGQYVGEAWLNVEHDFAAYKDPSGQSVGDLNLYKLSGPLQRIITGSPFIYSPTARK